MNETLKPLRDLYVQKDFGKLKDELLQKKDEFDSGVFHYNLGTIHAKLNEFAASRFHLEKALKEGYSNTLVLNNLKYVKNKINVQSIERSTSIKDMVIGQVGMVPSELFLSLSLFLILATVFGFYKKWYRSIKVLIVALTLSLIPFGLGEFYFKNLQSAVVLKESSLYEGPSKIYEPIGSLGGGSKIILGDQDGPFYLIKAPQNLSGWIHRENLGFL